MANEEMNNGEITYQETLDYLYSFIDYSLQRTFRYAPEKFDLGRMRQLAESLGNPQQSYPVIHVAGTKGKGSVAALCASALLASGRRVGFYSSPHLQDYAERIQINGQNIPHADLVAFVEKMKPQIEAIPALTTFEITTALAFLYFAAQKVDVAVIEVGLGGRLDATNIVMPVVSVITSLSFDHTNLLGNTLAQIAAEKGGIIKPGVPLVSSPQKEEARLVLEKIAAERSSRMILVGRDYLYIPLSHSLDGQELQVRPADATARPVTLSISLLGEHQVENAATAYAALQVAHSAGVTIDDEAIRKGFAAAEWPGRFEILRKNPPVVVDSAHNRDSALRLRQALDDYFPGKPVVLVFGASSDKDIQGMFAELMPRVRQVYATQSVHPRAIDPQVLAEMAGQYGRPAQAIHVVEDAFEEALRAAGDEAVVLVAGSIFVAAAAREIWQTLKDEFPDRTIVQGD